MLICLPVPVPVGSGAKRKPQGIGNWWLQYDGRVLRYHVAFFLPSAPGGTVVAEALDFPGAVSQGFDLPDARLMIASAMEDLAQLLLEEGKPLPTPIADVTHSSADLIELVPLSVHVGAHRV